MTTTSKTVVVLATGGTIAGTQTSATTGAYRAATLGIDQLLQTAVPAASDVTLEAEQVAQVDSKDMSHAIWHALAQRCAHHLARAEVAGIVITHGTDTMEETAYFLHRVVAAAKPIVLTGAMRAATATSPDGPGNLRQALLVAQWPNAQGVLVVMTGEVHAASTVHKVHPTRLHAFSSGPAGGLARIARGRLKAWDGGDAIAWPACDGLLQGTLAPPDDWPRVLLWPSHAGMDAGVATSMFEAAAAAGVQGIVVAATGNGTVHQALADACCAATNHGMAIGVATRCEQAGLDGVAWAPLADSLVGLPLHPSPAKARIDLMLRLMRL